MVALKSLLAEGFPPKHSTATPLKAKLDAGPLQ